MSQRRIHDLSLLLGGFWLGMTSIAGLIIFGEGDWLLGGLMVASDVVWLAVVIKALRQTPHRCVLVQNANGG